MPELPPLVYEDNATTIACREAFGTNEGGDSCFTWEDCDRGSFNCPGCPLTTLEQKNGI